MFMSVPAVRKDSGTSRWLRYGLFLSLSENDPGGMPPKTVTEVSQVLFSLSRWENLEYAEKI